MTGRIRELSTSVSLESQRGAERSIDAQIVLIVMLAWVAIFAVLTVLGWAKQRRLEREAFYRKEVQQQMIQAGELGAEQWLAIQRMEYLHAFRQRLDRLKLAGLVLTALGVGLLVAMSTRPEAPPVGWIPVAIGIVVLGHAWTSKPPAATNTLESLQPQRARPASSAPCEED